MSPFQAPELCVSGVAIRDNRMLLVKRGAEPGRGLWALPGGRVEPGETMLEAVVRETTEETTLTVVCDRLVGWVERIADNYHFVIMTFAITVMGNEQPSPGSDVTEAEWVPLWQVTELPLVDGLLDFLSEHKLIDAL